MYPHIRRVKCRRSPPTALESLGSRLLREAGVDVEVHDAPPLSIAPRPSLRPPRPARALALRAPAALGVDDVRAGGATARRRDCRDRAAAMTLTHTVILKWKVGVTNSDVRAGCEALAALPEQLPYVRSYRLGGDIKLPECPQNADFTIVAEFDSPDDYLKYAAAPEHLAAVAMLKPFLAGRTAVQSYAVEYCVFAQARRVLSDNVLRLQLAAALCGAAAGFALARRRYR